MISYHRGTVLKTGVALSAIVLLSACSGGSGGGGVSTLPPQPAPAPAPAPPPPPPPPPPATSFDTREVERSDGPEFHNAITPWQQGITGRGSAIAIIDTGIDSDSPEFTGRILPASRDVAGSRGIDGVDDHGTNVALIAAAALDNAGIVGLAYEASLLVLRADRPNSCTADEGDGDLAGCRFADADIARGIDAAIAANARVVNLSLGGGTPSQGLVDAVRRAAQAGIVIVVAAGNDGDTTDPALDPDNPDPFAVGTLAGGNGAVIIVGSVDENGQISDFSNRAGNFATDYLTARGERLCCAYENGVLKVEQQGNSSFVTLFSGTSFATPQVAGAVALLAQAFPNLTGQQIVEILLDTARDAGAAGTDAIYGRGILDLVGAFAPQGATSMAGTQRPLSLADDIVIASGPMGDAIRGASLPGIVLDKYDRAYTYDLASRARVASADRLLERAAQTGLRRVAVGSEQVAMAFTLDQRRMDGRETPLTPLRLSHEQSDAARVLAARVALRIAPDTSIGLAFAEGPEGLSAQLQGRERPAFLIAPGAAGELGFAHRDRQSAAVRRDLGPVAITLSAGTGEALTGAARQGRDIIGLRREGFGLTRVGLTADRQFGPLGLTLGVDLLREDRTMLGAYLHDSFGSRGAQSIFADGAAALDLGDGWSLGAQGRYGTTSATAGGNVDEGTRFSSVAFSFDAGKRGLFQAGDRLGFRFASPLRVTHGALVLDLPDSYDYATQSADFALRRVSLAPNGRELMGELGWTGEVLDGVLATSLFYRSEPGHIAAAPDDAGLLVRWSRGF